MTHSRDYGCKHTVVDIVDERECPLLLYKQAVQKVEEERNLITRRGDIREWTCRVFLPSCNTPLPVSNSYIPPSSQSQRLPLSLRFLPFSKDYCPITHTNPTTLPPIQLPKDKENQIQKHRFHGKRFSSMSLYSLQNVGECRNNRLSAFCGGLRLPTFYSLLFRAHGECWLCWVYR
jgi:hypothetical protein